MDNNTNNNDITVFAETNFRNQRRRFGIKTDDRRRHMYLIGKTGMGKSTVLENMIVNDIRAGRGVAVADPHGDLVEKVLNYIPSNRVNDVINFNPADMEYPVAFNPLESIDPKYKHLISSGLIAVFKKLWAESWGPRLEYLLRNAILALLDTNGTTLLGIMRILVDKNYRKKIVANIKDPVVKAFWVDEYSKYPDKFQVEAISPIQNKVGQFLSNFLIRNIVGQVKSSFDMREVMDQRKILLMNLSKGRIGEDTSSLLGAMMITKIQLAAMDRINIPENERQDFYLYVDEFQNFATESFATILSEARKYRLDLIIAHQYIEQLNDMVRAAVFGNVGTMVVFRIGATDAEELVKEFTPKFTEDDLVNIPKYECYMKLMVDGIATDPFSARGLAPLHPDEVTDNREKVIRLSRERYAEKREIIEEKIFRWSGVNLDEDKNGKSENKKGEDDVVASIKGPRDFKPKPDNHFVEKGKSNPNNTNSTSNPSNKNNINHTEPLPKEKFKNESVNGQKNKISQIGNNDDIKDNNAKEKNFADKKIYLSQCSICGKETKVNFKPDNIRSIFCKECFKKVKQGEISMPSLMQKGNNEKEAEESQEISISEALKLGAVDFKGKKIEPSLEQKEDNEVNEEESSCENGNNEIKNGPIERAGEANNGRIEKKDEAKNAPKDYNHTTAEKNASENEKNDIQNKRMNKGEVIKLS